MQAANIDVIVKCISKEGKSETMSCSDQAGNEMSQLTGNEKKLIKWAKSKECQASTECKSLDKIQAKNKAIKVICINDMGKTKVMSCADHNGTILSTKKGKMKDLIKWVQSNECKTGDDLSRKVI